MKQKINECWYSYLNSPNDFTFRALFEASYKKLFRYGQKISNDNNITRDAIQEVFLNLWKYKNKIKHKDNPLPYLLRSVRNEIVRISSKEEKARKTPIPKEVTFMPAELQDGKLSPEELKILTEEINKLPKKQKEILYLHYFDEISYQNIATIVGTKYQSVVNLAFKAISTLRKNEKLRKSNFF